MIAFRNRLVHGYWSIDLQLVWDVIERDLPLLKGEVTRLLAEPGSVP
ncbi:MAG TPA: HepT-like ribonuclease domain-containing protein [Acetobacteraceae bacterium]